MAKPSWVHISPVTGSGNTTITVYVDAFYGNTDRTGTAIIKGKTTGSKTLSITQSKGALDGSVFQKSISFNTSGTGRQITFTTNAIGFRLTTDGTIGWNLPTTFTINGTSYPMSSAAPIPNNPGKDGLFTITFTVSASVNSSTSQKTGNLHVRYGYQSTTSEGHITVPATQQAVQITHYTVYVSLMPINPEAGDNCQWKLSCARQPVSTRIQGQVSIYRNDGDFDIVSVDGIVDEYDNNSIALNYYKNPDNISGQISAGNLSGTSQVSGYVCDGVSG